MLIDWVPPDDWPLLLELRRRFQAVSVEAAPAAGGFNSRLEKLLFLWRVYVLSTTRAFFKYPNVELVYAWQPVLGLLYAFYCRLFFRRRVKIAVSHLIVPFRAGLVTKFKSLFIRFCLRRVHLIIVSSSVEVDKFAGYFHLPSKKICCNPLGIDPPKAEPHRGDYIFSGGRSNRDYRTFCTAVDGLKSPVQIIAQKFNLEHVAVPPNVTVRYGLFGEAFDRALADCRFAVIPLDRPEESSGQLVLLAAMYLGKAVIITDNKAVHDYVQDGQTALLVPPHDPSAMRAAIERLLNDEALAQRVGAAARRRVLDHFLFETTMKRLVAYLTAL